MITAAGKAPAPGAVRSYLSVYAVERGIGSRSLGNLNHNLNSFERHLGRSADWPDVTTANVNGWLCAELERGIDPETVRTRKISLVGVWKEAFDSGVAPTAPAKIRKIKVPSKIPVCWDMPELELVRLSARQLTGHMKRDRTISRADFFEAYVLVGYDIGLRLGDLCRLMFEQIGADGRIVIVQNKTGDMVIGQLGPASMAAIERIRRLGRRRLFGDLINKANAQKQFRKIVRSAGVRGSTKWLRKTGATWCEAHNPGGAKAYLGHRTAGLAYKNYVDPRFVQQKRPGPPPLA